MNIKIIASVMSLFIALLNTPLVAMVVLGSASTLTLKTAPIIWSVSLTAFIYLTVLDKRKK